MAVAVVGLSTLSCRGGSAEDAASLMCAASSVQAESSQGVSPLGPDGTSKNLAQSFSPQATVKQVDQVSLALQATTTFGSFVTSDSVALLLRASDSSGNPDLNTVLATSSLSLGGNALPNGSARWVSFTLDHKLDLTAGTTYWLELVAQYTNPATHYVTWMASDLNPYASGEARYYSSGAWLAVDPVSPGQPKNTRDFVFKVGCL